MVSECVLTWVFDFSFSLPTLPFCNDTFLIPVQTCRNALFYDKCSRTLIVCCINTNLPHGTWQTVLFARVCRCKSFLPRLKTGLSHPVWRSSPCTLFGGAANVHTMLCPVLQFTLVLPACCGVVAPHLGQVFFFFFFTLRAMKCTVHAQSCVVCFWVVSLFNFFASVMLLRRTSARFASFSGSLSVDHFQPGFPTVVDFHPLTFSNSHRFLLIVMVLHCFACLYLWVVFVNLKGFALACVQWA